MPPEKPRKPNPEEEKTVEPKASKENRIKHLMQQFRPGSRLALRIPRGYSREILMAQLKSQYENEKSESMRRHGIWKMSANASKEIKFIIAANHVTKEIRPITIRERVSKLVGEGIFAILKKDEREIDEIEKRIGKILGVSLIKARSYIVQAFNLYKIELEKLQ